MFFNRIIQRIEGIEPSSSAWKADNLPLVHIRFFYLCAFIILCAWISYAQPKGAYCSSSLPTLLKQSIYTRRLIQLFSYGMRRIGKQLYPSFKRGDFNNPRYAYKKPLLVQLLSFLSLFFRNCLKVFLSIESISLNFFTILFIKNKGE